MPFPPSDDIHLRCRSSAIDRYVGSSDFKLSKSDGLEFRRESIQVLACSLHSYIFKELKKRAAFNLLCKINSELLLEAGKCWLSVVHTYLHMQLVDSLLQNHLQITL